LHVTLDESGLRYTPDKPPVEIRLTKTQLRSLATEPPVTVAAATAEEAYRAARKLHDKKQSQAPLMRAVEGRIAAIQQRQIAELQLKLFPDWPDDRRGAPNTVIRSAIFGVIRRGRRQRVSDLPVAAPNGWSITMTGWRLDQHDLDLWLEVHHLARNAKPGEEVRFTLHSMLRRIGRTGKLGGDNYAWLEERLKALYQTTLLVDSGRHVGGAGNLIRNFRLDRETGEALVETNPTLRTLWSRSPICKLSNVGRSAPTSSRRPFTPCWLPMPSGSQCWFRRSCIVWARSMSGCEISSATSKPSLRISSRAAGYEAIVSFQGCPQETEIIVR